MKYYAVFFIKENKKTIYLSWDECSKNIKNNSVRYKSFNSVEKANEWLNNGANYLLDKTTQNLPKDCVYFDAGTGRKIGVEARITDVNKNSLLHFVLDKSKINEYGNYLLENRTNNFGELTALFFALKYALKYNIKNICGDSELVIKYWANKIYNKQNLDEDTIKLIHLVNDLYLKFKKNGGSLTKISGDINPSDLGFHK